MTEMSENLEHLDFIPEPSDPRILSAADPLLRGHQEGFRSVVTGWDPEAPPQSPLTQKRLFTGPLPVGLLFVIAIGLSSWWGLGAFLGVDDLQYPDSEWAYEQSGIRILQQGKGLDGEGIHVCIVDTGVDLNHDDLDHLNIGFRDFVSSSDTPIDHGLDNHGTMMVGILVADGHLKGAAPGVSLSVAAALGEHEGGETVGETSLVAKAVEWCWKDMGADIISLSLGGMQNENATSGKEVEDAVSEALSKGVFVVAAAGNDGGFTDDGLVSSPANIPLVISVGASVEGGGIWESSSKDTSTTSPDGSPREDPNLKPELIAPGHDIISTAPGTQYYRSSGTSGATVFVSGSLALLLQEFPSMSRNGGSTTNSCIVAMKQALMDSIEPEVAGRQHDDYFGYGHLNTEAWYITLAAQQSSNPC
ncbi:MAG TPA: hypothetical protein EYQ85_07715 [Candidatus Poseidoniales archaeon]|jgi:serine protease AprX|nr:MAG: hypothetical protein CXT68_00125 [Euryarchaeota archaeon]HIF17117.1 hypothetical protein [Candidatus Poseidoniales archaeon]